MPYRTTWVNPAVYLIHAGVTVYHVYKHDEITNGPRTYEFTTIREGNYDDETGPGWFDVRELPTWVEPTRPPFLTGGNDTPENRAAWGVFQKETEPAAIRAAVRAAIDRGVLTKDGVTQAAEATT